MPEVHVVRDITRERDACEFSQLELHYSVLVFISRS